MNKFWNFEITHYITESKPGLLESYKPKGKYSEDYNGLFELLGTSPHPSMRLPLGKEHIEPPFLSFQHILVDINTIKILLILLGCSKIVSLKFCSNNFEVPALETLINGLINKSNSIYTLVFEWNHTLKLENSKEIVSWNPPTENPENQSLVNRAHSCIAKIPLMTKIESLCLRGNYLGDEAIIILTENLKNNNTLKILNLYNNCISSKSFTAFCSFLETNKKLEEVHLGKNLLVDEDLVSLKKIVGKFLMSAEEVENYQKKSKERDAIIEKNKKLKNQRKPEEPVPFLEEMTQIGDNFYIVRNTKLKSLNLMQNQFSNCYDLVLSLLKQTDTLFLTLDSTLFDKEQRHSLSYPSGGMNFSTRIYLSK
jgi:hypothetical protein